MLAAMTSHVDQFRCQRDRVNRGRNYLIGMRHESDHRAVVIRVDMGIQHTSCRDISYRRTQTRDRFFVATLTEVWYTLNESAD